MTSLLLPPPISIVDRHVRIQSARLESSAALLWWSGVAVLAGVVGRGVATRILGPHGPLLHPNLFIVLVGEANSGKSVAVRAAKDSLDGLYIRQAADSTPPEAFHGWLAESTVKCIEEGQDTGLFLGLESMDSFFDRRIPRSLKALLNAAYDCAPRYDRNTYRHRIQGVQKLCLNILAAGTPAHIASCFGADDWVDGLASRFLFVAGGQARVGQLLPWEVQTWATQTAALQTLRQEVESLPAPLEIPWSEEAWAAQSTWRLNPPPRSPHPYASGYRARKHTTVCKLACLMAVARAGRAAGTVIDLQAWRVALDALRRVESGLPYCLSHIGSNPYAAVQTRLLEWAAGVNRPVREQEIRRHLWQFIPPQYADACIEQLITAGLLIVQSNHSTVAPNRTLLHHSLQKSQSWSAIVNTKAASSQRP